jgi:dinuclear metal center YbgI/SA1388 family protein
MKLSEIIASLETLAPPALQEGYDNSGLLVGSSNMEITGAIVCLDSTQEVIEEAIRRKCNLVIAHHPIIFSGLKKLNGKNYIERSVMLAIKNDIAIYAIHTNLDNVHVGVNSKIAEKLGLIKTTILDPKTNLLQKLVVYAPKDNAEKVRQAMFNAGAGHIGHYDQCSFNSDGTGTFRPGIHSNPQVGSIGHVHFENETKIEVIAPNWLINNTINAVKEVHTYEEVAYDVVNLENALQTTGSGMLGYLPQPMDSLDFLKHLKSTMKAGVIKHTALVKPTVHKIAICGGSGSFLLPQSIKAQADVLVTADFKYHQFFDAEDKIIIADIGHFESEQFTIQLLVDWLKLKFPTFASHFTEVNTNPVSYL